MIEPLHRMEQFRAHKLAEYSPEPIERKAIGNVRRRLPSEHS